VIKFANIKPEWSRAAFHKAEIEKWLLLIKAANVKVDW